MATKSEVRSTLSRGADMTPSETKTAASIMLAWAEGKKVEFRSRVHCLSDGSRPWKISVHPDGEMQWDFTVTDYRLAPEPPRNTMKKYIIARTKLEKGFIDEFQNPNKIHDTKGEAINEAFRLAGKHPNGEFVVFEAVCSVASGKPVVTMTPFEVSE